MTSSQKAPTYRTPMTDEQAARFCTAFAEGLRSGADYTRVLGFLERRGLKPKVIGMLRSAFVRHGLGFAEALRSLGLLDEASRDIIEVAERQATLPEVLTYQAQVFRARYERKKRIISSSAEPILLLLLIGGVFGPIFLNFEALAIEHRDESALTLISMFVAPALLQFLVYVLLLVAALYAWLRASVNSPLRAAFARYFLSVPLISRSARQFAYATFARYLATSVRSGLSVVEGLRLAAKASRIPGIQDAVERAIDSIRQGANLESSLSQTRALPQELIEYVGLGEETGQLEPMLMKCSEEYFNKANASAESMLKIFVSAGRFALVFGLTIVGGYRVLSELLPRFTEIMDNLSP